MKRVPTSILLLLALVVFIIGVQVGISRGRDLAASEFVLERTLTLAELDTCEGDLEELREGWQRTSATLVECQKDRQALRSGFPR